MIIYAVNVHTGGGKVLLDEILRTHEFGRCTVLFVDERYRVPDDATVRDTRIVRVPPRLLRRWQAEWELRRVSRAMPSEEVLCFGNLPPVFRLPSRTILFLQNAFLLPGIAAPRDSLKTFLRCSYEKTWFRAFVSNADEIQVQTNWMRERLPPRLRAKAAIRVIMPTLPAPRAGVAKRYLFLAVSGHERHKNLNVLLQALRQVDLGGNRVAIVTGSPGAGAPPGLENSIDFHHGLSRDAVLALYEESRCLVMTSEIESFCLPLYEARHFGLDVIATRSGFVTEALAPGVVIGDVTPEGVAAALRQYMDAHTARSQESRTGAETGPARHASLPARAELLDGSAVRCSPAPEPQRPAPRAGAFIFPASPPRVPRADGALSGTRDNCHPCPQGDVTMSNVPKTRVLVLGATGMLGNAVLRLFAESPGYEITGSVRSPAGRDRLPQQVRDRVVCGVDVENPDALTELFARTRPDVVVNCIGLVKQMSNAEDPLAALPVNAMLPHRLARLCDVARARLIHVSTDCVFSGDRGNYREDDFPDAGDVYGRSKYLGEVDYPHAVTMRTSIIGHELGTAHGLVGWFLAQQGEVRGYGRAVFSGLPTVELARVMRDHVIPNRDLHGVYHVSADPINKLELLRLVARAYDKDIGIVPDERVVIDRSLDSSRFRELTGYRPPAWPELVQRMRDFG